jgi:FixJ family two-component response regulator
MRMSSATQTYVAIIDDDESLSRSLGRFLRASGIQATAYASAEAFLAGSERSRFDCLIIDVQLGGGMTGLDLSQRLAASGSTIPVIFNTASDLPGLREQAFQGGCFTCVQKIDAGETLLTAIAEAIRSGQGNNRVHREH